MTKLTESKILELAEYWFFKGNQGKWSGVTDEGLLMFALEIQKRVLGEMVTQLEEKLNSVTK